jgi:hypothetical protein
VVEAFTGLAERLVVVGDGTLPSWARATLNITFLGHVDEENLLRLYRESRALRLPGRGRLRIAMAEAQPAARRDRPRRRGATDIVRDGETGCWRNRRSRRCGRPLAREAARSTPPRSGDRPRLMIPGFGEIRAAIGDSRVLGGREGLNSCDTERADKLWWSRRDDVSGTRREDELLESKFGRRSDAAR